MIQDDSLERDVSARQQTYTMRRFSFKDYIEILELRSFIFDD